MQAQWQDKLHNVAEQLRTQSHKIYSCLYPVTLHRIYPHELHHLQQNCDLFQQSLHVLELNDKHLQKFYLQFDNDDRKISVLTGHFENIQDSLYAITHGDIAAYHQSLGTPACCSRFLAKLKQHKIQEAIWPMAQDGLLTGEQKIKIQGHFATNPLLYPLGIYLLHHQACSSNCDASISLAEDVINTAIKMGHADVFNTVKDILSWHYSWSTLHGIAELKTPLFKMIYNSQACAIKYQVDWVGCVQLDTGIIGTDFPYQTPKKRIFTDSAAYRRGLVNQIE